jgi:tRNA threonylcarbamoyladenosine biosynthesis protein TsaE
MQNNQPITKLISGSEEETKNIAKSLIEKGCPSPFCLYGDLGAGKTIFVKGFARYFGVQEEKVKSPTFSFVREYAVLEEKISHCDLYRLSAPDEILVNQLEESYSKGPVIIEWAEKIEDYLPEERTDVLFEYIDKDKRQLTIKVIND